jgi:transcriptional regulator with XRE-family HTH domain
MREHGVSVRAAAKVAGVAVSTIENWRNGSPPRDFRSAQKLSRRLGVSLSFLLTGECDSRNGGAPRLEEVLSDGGEIFEGFVEVRIKRLVPKNGHKLTGTE